VAFGQIDYVKKGPVFKASIWLALICSIYAIIANASYIWIGLKGKLKLAGGSVAHLGFGMVCWAFWFHHQIKKHFPIM
jgi:cytochrome c-type biogenesis protein CcmF